ncbi:MAG TPA: hypothetical protein VJO54_00390 [Burkholderiales bacterium]|nr:hypothetical protein [Burkholderiales bacterium]
MLCIAGCITHPSRDEFFSSRLSGKWSASSYIGSGTIEQSIDLRADGTFQLAGTLRNVQGALRFSASGTWRVQDGNLIYEIAESDSPENFRPGERRYRIISVSDWELVTTENNAELEQRAWRYPN